MLDNRDSAGQRQRAMLFAFCSVLRTRGGQRTTYSLGLFFERRTRIVLVVYSHLYVVPKADHVTKKGPAITRLCSLLNLNRGIQAAFVGLQRFSSPSLFLMIT